MNRLHHSFAIVLAFVCGLGLSAAAGDAVIWTNTVTTAANWFNPAANWTLNGVPLTAAPGAGEDIVLTDLEAIPSAGMGTVVGEQAIWAGQTIYTPPSDDSTHTDAAERLAIMTNATIGKVTGDFRHTIVIDNRTGDGMYAIKNMDKIPAPDGGSGRYIEVSDPDDFYGIWFPKGNYSRLIVNQKNAAKPAILRNFNSGAVPVISVMSGSAAKVEVLTGGGMIRKASPGKLTIGQVSAEQTKLQIEAGEVELLGHAEGDLAAILAKSAIHLDASADTVETGSDGSVIRWRDSEGREDLYAAVNSNRSYSAGHQLLPIPPRLVAKATANGLPLVDFAFKGKNPGTRKQCPVLELSQRFANVREVYFVVDCPHGGNATYVLGDYPNNRTSLQFSPGYDDNNLWSSDYSDPCVRHGDIFLNGKSTPFNACNGQLTALHTVAQNTLADTCVYLIGSREYYGTASGGARIGEVILFTNELTRAERVFLSNHLNVKWGTAAYGSDDLSAVFAKESTASTISVPAGRIARIGQLRADKGLIKSGAGTLEIGEIYPANMKITVNGGKVVVRKPAEPTLAPAEGAYVHLDATAIPPEDVTPQDGTNYVKQWNDCRGLATYAKTTHETGCHIPRLVDSPITGTKVVDFGVVNGSGTLGDNTAAAMQMSNWGSGSLIPYHYFAVFRMKSVNNRAVPIVSGVDMATYRDSSALFSPNYRTASSIGSVVRLNGVQVDPLAAMLYDDVPETTNQFYVISVSAATPFKMNGLACQRSGADKQCGGMEFAEVITYCKPLTVAEQQQTEAYLMDKWLDRRLPSQEPLSPVLTFGAEADVAFDTDADMTVGKVTGGNGTVIKSGAGAVTVGELDVPPTVIDVAGGFLEMPVKAATFLDDALFHFDVSRLHTLTCTVEDGATNVSEIADVRGNGLKATALIDELATVKPKLVSVETKAGSGRYIPALDFGGYSWKTNDYAVLADTPSAAMTYSSVQTIKHALTVFADAHGAHQQSVLSQSNAHEFQRNWNTGSLYWEASTWNGTDVEVLKASSIVRNSVAGTLLDGQGVNSNTSISEGFHIFDFIPSQSRTSDTHNWKETVSAMVMSYGHADAHTANKEWGYDYPITWSDRGGQYVTEQMGFGRMLTADEQAYVKALLDCKWFGKAHPGYLATNELTTLSVAADSTLVLHVGDAVLVNAMTLSGTGTIVVDALSVTDEIDVTVANGGTDHLVVNGEVSFGGALTVNVTADLSSGKIAAGRYPILTAANFVGFEEATVTVNLLTDRSGIYSARVVRDGDTLYLETMKSGLLMLVR